MAECHIHNILDTSLFRVTRRLSALLQADAELRTEGSSYRPRSAYTRTAVHRTSARLPLHDRLSECVNQLPPFAPRIRSANSIWPSTHFTPRSTRRSARALTRDCRLARHLLGPRPRDREMHRPSNRFHDRQWPPLYSAQAPDYASSEIPYGQFISGVGN